MEPGDKLCNGHHLVDSGQGEPDAVAVARTERDEPERWRGLHKQEACTLRM
jgi:hypothetical protein